MWISCARANAVSCKDAGITVLFLNEKLLSQ